MISALQRTVTFVERCLLPNKITTWKGRTNVLLILDLFLMCPAQNALSSPQHRPHSNDLLALGRGCSGQRVSS